MRLKGSLVGPLVTLAVLAAFVILDATMVRIQNPAPIFLIAVTFSGYVGGVAPALASAALAIAFSLYYFLAPGQLLVYTPADQARRVLDAALEARAVRAAFLDAVAAATSRSRELGRG